MFDLHEAHMASLDRSHEEMRATIEEIRATSAKKSAEHEARMARLERNDLLQVQRLDEARRQTRELISEISRLDVERKVESARNRLEHERNMEEHLRIMAALKAIQDKASSS